LSCKAGQALSSKTMPDTKNEHFMTKTNVKQQNTIGAIVNSYNNKRAAQNFIQTRKTEDVRQIPRTK
jgi:hypothetical protein